MSDTTATKKNSQPLARLTLPLGKILAAMLVTTLLTILLLALSGFFHRKVAIHEAQRPAIEIDKLASVEVKRIRRPRFEAATGTIKAVHEAAVASRLLARVVEVRVKAGQTVQQGEVLVRLDDVDLVARRKQAEANLQSAKATLDVAVTEFSRAKQLYSAKAISAQDFDRATTTQRTAAAEASRAEQAVQEATALLEFTTVKSPLTGVVIDKKVDVGDTATPGQALVTVFNPGRMQMVATVRESLALRLKVGQKILGRIESLDHECEATISEIVPESQAASRSFTVKVVGPCPPGIYSGMFGRIYIPLDDEEIVVIPASLVRRVGQLEMVDVLEDRMLRRRNIQTGRLLGSDLEVLSGLKVGEKIVLTGQRKEVAR